MTSSSRMTAHNDIELLLLYMTAYTDSTKHLRDKAISDYVLHLLAVKCFVHVYNHTM